MSFGWESMQTSAFLLKQGRFLFWGVHERDFLIMLEIAINTKFGFEYG
jgi:hypothetical protein